MFRRPFIAILTLALAKALLCAPLVFAQLNAPAPQATDGTELTETAIKCGGDASCARQPTSGGTSPNSASQQLGPNQVAPAAFQKQGYERADENIATQAEYLMRRIDTLETFKDPENDKIFNKDGNGFTAERLEGETEGYCNLSSDDTKETHDDAQKCLDEYIELKRAQLEKIGPNLTKNADSVTRLQSKPLDENGKPLPGDSSNAIAVQPSIDPGKTFADYSPPFVPKFVDLTPAHEQVQKNPERPKEEQDGMKMLTDEPKEADFYKTTDALLDPANPAAGTTKILVLKPDGQPDVDKDAYRKAHESWLSGTGIYEGRGTETGGSKFAERVAARVKADAQKMPHSARKKELAEIVGERNKALPASDKTLIRKDFVAARNILVMNFNGEVHRAPGSDKKGGGTENATTAANKNSAQTATNKPLDSEYINGDKEEDLKLKPKTGIPAKDEVNSLYLDPDSIQKWVREETGVDKAPVASGGGNAPPPGDTTGGGSASSASARSPATTSGQPQK